MVRYPLHDLFFVNLQKLNDSYKGSELAIWFRNPLVIKIDVIVYGT